MTGSPATEIGSERAEPERAEPERAEPALAEPEQRGRTEIADRVLERIAARALTEVDEVGGSARRVLGVPLGRDNATAAPRVSAQVDGDLATLQMTISVTYPTPISRAARELRERVTARVGELTGLEVRQVDIVIASLIRAGSRGGRVQ